MADLVKFYDYGAVQSYRFKAWPMSGGSLGVHVFFVDGLLIDTGFPNLRRTIKRTLEHLDVGQMLITHHHEDHSGNTALLRRMFQCPVWASAKTADVMRSPPRVSPVQALSWGQNRAYRDYQILGDQFQTNKYNFDIIPIPGHASDMIALHEPDQGWLFSADLYVYHRIKYFMRSENMQEQIDSLERVLQLDFDKLFCSHNPQIEGDIHGLLRKKIQYFKDFQGRVIEAHQKGMNVRAIVDHLNIHSPRMKITSAGNLSADNMVRAVLRDFLK